MGITLWTKDLSGSPQGMAGIPSTTGSQVANYCFLDHAWKICRFSCQESLARLRTLKLCRAFLGFSMSLEKMLVDPNLLCWSWAWIWQLTCQIWKTRLILWMDFCPWLEPDTKGVKVKILRLRSGPLVSHPLRRPPNERGQSSMRVSILCLLLWILGSFICGRHFISRKSNFKTESLSQVTSR